MLNFLIILSVGIFLNNGSATVVYDTDDSTMIRVDLRGTNNDLKFFIAVPPRERVEVRDVLVTSFDGKRQEINDYVAQRPAYLRDAYVLPLEVIPGEKAKSVEIKLTYTGAHLRRRQRRGNYISPYFADFYRTVLLNPAKFLGEAEIKRPAFGEGAELVVITLEDFVPYLEPFLQWKRASGLLTRVYTPEDIGASPQDIKEFLQDAYYNWEIPPEYVLFVSDTLGWTGTENYYGTMDDDSLNDIMPGRLPASDTFELKIMVRKIIAYEKEPYLDDPSWFKKATLIVREDNQQFSDSVYWADVEYVADLMADFGYVHIDTFWNDNSGSGPNNADDIVAAVTEGRSYVLFRGQGVNNWWPPFSVNPQATENDRKLPIILSGTCSTAGQEQIGFTWLRAGSNSSLKGAVGFFGTTGVGSGISNKRSLCVRGFFNAVFADSSATFGLASEAGRLAIYNVFEELDLYNEWRTLGDPSLKLWTSTPESIEITAPDSIAREASSLTVSVSLNGTPVSGACVALLQDTVFISRGFTDASGIAVIPLNLVTIDSLMVTVTGNNLKPYQIAVPVYSEGPFLSLEGTNIDDSPGNNNGELNPGEQAYLGFTAANWGRTTASEVEAFISTTDPYVTILDSAEALGDLLPDSTVSRNHAFLFEIDNACPSGHVICFTLTMADNSGDTARFDLTGFEVRGALVSLESISVQDGPPGGNSNGLLEPGEAAYLELGFHNESNVDLSDLQIVFLMGDTGLVYPVEKRAFLEHLPAGGSGSTEGLKLSVVSRPGVPVSLKMPWIFYVEGNAGTFTYRDTITAYVRLGTPDSTSPTGPDPGGYFIYDDNDQSSGLAPTFDWYELAPPGPGELLSAISNEDDDTTTVTLLFGFKFYGNSTNSIGISTNGLLEVGGASYPDPENFPIPSTGAPNSLVAALWEDLDPLFSGDIYQYLDYPNHRWIIEFKDVRQKSTGGTVTFQVIFLDPAYHETPTGDGEIIIQYASIGSVASSCVGLEGPAGEKGLQYAFRGTYDLTASALDSGRVLLISTRRPLCDSAAWIVPIRRSVSDESGGNGNGHLEPGETIELYLTLADLGEQPLEGVSALLSSRDGDAIPIDSIANYGNMAPGQHSVNENPLTFQVANSPADSLLEFDITITGENGYTAHAYIEFPLYSRVAVSENGSLAHSGILRLNPVVPNPIRDRAAITFSVPVRGLVTLDLFDVSGRKVNVIFEGRVNPGIYRINWQPLDRRGKPLHAGIYFLSLNFEGKRLTKKLMVLR